MPGTIRQVKSFPLVTRPPVPDTIEQPEAALAQDGVFTRSQARAGGWSDGRQRRLIERGVWVPITATVLRHRGTQDGPWLRARAVSLSGLVVSHHTAGQLWGLEIQGTPALHGTSQTWHRPVVPRAHRARLTVDELVEVAGLRVTSTRRTLGDILCAQPGEESVAMITDALRRGLLTVTDLNEIAGSVVGRHGAADARFVASTCAGRPFSVLEWRFHRLVGQLGPGWEFNVEIHDEAGLVGVVDAVHHDSRTIVELDGRAHHGSDRFQLDRTRDQRLAALGYVVIRLTWDDVTRRAPEVLARIARTVARRLAAA